MIIDCISDPHGHYPKLEGGDLLIVAGDLTARDTLACYNKFFDWFSLQPYTKKVYIAGNHDNLIQQNKTSTPKYCDASYLCDSGTEFEGLKIWGSPWTRSFEGMNEYCKAFTCDTEEQLTEKWALIPDDVDILVTHSPRAGVLDLVLDDPMGRFESCPVSRHVGSRSLNFRCQELNYKLHIWGHIHESYGMQAIHDADGDGIIHLVNASHVNEHYQPVNKPIRIEL